MRLYTLSNSSNMSKPNRPNLPQLMRTARTTLTDRLNDALQQAGLSLSQWEVLTLLDKTAEIDLATLRQQAGKLAERLSPALDALEKAGLIEYCQNEQGKTVQLTGRGHFLLQRVNPKIAFLYGQLERRKNHPALKSAYQTLAQLVRPKDK